MPALQFSVSFASRRTNSVHDDCNWHGGPFTSGRAHRVQPRRRKTYKAAGVSSPEMTEAEPKNMDRWLGDGGMAIVGALGGSFESYGVDGEDLGWAVGSFTPSELACNPSRFGPSWRARGAA
jgi:hypothetical protein